MKRLFLSFAALFSVIVGHAQPFTIDVVGIPATSKDSTLYIAGNFNGWNPSDKPLHYDPYNKKWTITLSGVPKVIEYKITRGSWDKVETTATGSDIANRKLVSGNAVAKIEIQGWKDQFAHAMESTASSNVYIVDDAFYFPALKRKKSIRIYLPEGYKKGSTRYPVIYMHDGQNLFDKSTAAYGEWGLDEFMDTLKSNGKVIIVGIDNGSRRMNEYNPWHTKRFGTGEGKLYVQDIAQTLKPYIDKHYRTLPDVKNTTIAGSSMGGLISMYAILAYPKVFGTAGVFSPSFWIAPNIYKEIKLAGKKFNNNIYLYAGEQESAGLVNEVSRAKRYLQTFTTAKVTMRTTPNAGHNEAAWNKAFPIFYKWLNR